MDGVTQILESFTGVQFGGGLEIPWRIVCWVVPTIMVSLCIGFYLGRGFYYVYDNHAVCVERERMLNALGALVQSTQELSDDVDSRNSELENVGESVSHINQHSQFEFVQRQLITQIEHALESNKRLEDDLQAARYRMEEQAIELDRTRKEARTDALSGVANRKFLDEKLRLVLSRFERHGARFCLLLCDVDHFKWINDTHGHQAGDLVVTGLGAALTTATRPSDFVARYGGDEFVVLLMGIDQELGLIIGERIRQTIATHNFEACLNGSEIAVTFSMGLATPEPGDSPSTLMARADAALYRSKHLGRNQLQVYSPALEGIMEDCLVHRAEKEARRERESQKAAAEPAGTA